MTLRANRGRRCPKYLANLRQAHVGDAVVKIPSRRLDETREQPHAQMLQLPAHRILKLPNVVRT